MNKASVHSRGFVLIAALMIIAVLVALVTAFTIAMRTERNASHNFAERERAQAIANGMLNRIIADEAEPVLKNGPQLGLPDGRLEPYTVDSNSVPTITASNTYLAAPTPAANVQMLNQIYTMPPTPGISSSNHLVCLSGTNIDGPDASKSTWAYYPQYWAYARQSGTGEYASYTPMDDLSGNPVAPSWVNYYDSTGTNQVGQVAYAIWDEGGKFDINMAGPDGTTSTGTNYITGRLNGLAPHDLKFEYLASDPTALLNYLNGDDGQRQRSNFALREIVPSSPANNTGDDRSIFSVEQMLAQNMLTPAAALDVTTLSRDFEVRPEWDGNREAASAVNYLKSYINNPNLFNLFLGLTAKGGPNLVTQLSQNNQNPLNTEIINNVLNSNGITPTDDWREVMRLLGVLRTALPPGTSYVQTSGQNGSGSNEDLRIPASPTKWSDQDVYATALNILQAGDPANDVQIPAYNTANNNQPYNDPSMRVGVRLSPYIVESAINAVRLNSTQITVTEYVKVWNPYPVEIDVDPVAGPVTYGWGASWSGQSWPNPANSSGPSASSTGLFANDDTAPNSSYAHPFTTTAKTLAPNSFTVLTPHTRTLNLATGHDFVMLCRPWMYNQNYYTQFNAQFGTSGQQSLGFVVSGGPIEGFPYPGYTAPDGSTGTDLALSSMFYVIPQKKMDQTGTPNWFSWQVDDPRMGTMARCTQIQPQPGGADYTPKVNSSSSYTTPWSATSNPPHLPENGSSPTLCTGVLNSTVSSTQGINYSPMYYSWQPYPGLHDLWVTSAQAPFVQNGYKANTTYGNVTGPLPGCNQNFLAPADMPLAWKKLTSKQQVQRALATFALPGRPLTNLGELATVHAFRPWTTLSMAQGLPLSSTNAGTTLSVPNAKLALLLDYYTTIGTTINPATDLNLTYAKSTSAPPPTLLTTNITQRNQNKIWLFDSTDPSGNPLPTAHLRPIRGRINLNTASRDTLMRLICGQGNLSTPSYPNPSIPYSIYTLVGSCGNLPSSQWNTNDNWVRTSRAVGLVPIEASNNIDIAGELADDIIALRPLRKMSDLLLGGNDGLGLNSNSSVNLPSVKINGGTSIFQRLQNDKNLSFDSQGNYIGYVADAILSRLAQFGTVRAQAYTIDMVARALKTTPSGQHVVTGEVRMMAHVYFDSFTRNAFVQSLEYR